jgi:hypothetical protein
VGDPQDTAGLLGQEQLEGVGAEIEYGAAGRIQRHPFFKAGRKKVGKTFGRPRRKGSE